MMEDSGWPLWPQGSRGSRSPIIWGGRRTWSRYRTADDSRVFTLDWRALLIVMPPGHEGCEVEWSVGYEAPVEPERDEDEGMEW